MLWQLDIETEGNGLTSVLRTSEAISSLTPLTTKNFFNYKKILNYEDEQQAKHKYKCISMRKTTLILLLLSPLCLHARQWTADEVKEVVRLVNTYWQQNNKAEVRAFWDNAAYHT